MKLNIQNRLLLPVICVVALIMAGSSWVTYNATKSQLDQTYQASLEVIADVMLKNVQSSTKSIMESVVGLSKDPQLMELLKAIEHKDGVDQALTPATAIITQYNSQFTDYPVLTLAGPDGLVATSSEANTIGKINVSHRSYFQKAMQGKANISEPMVSQDIKDKVVVVAVPMASEGKVLGVLFAQVPCKTIMAKTIDGLKIGKTGFPYIIDSNSKLMVAHPIYSNVQERSFAGTDWVEESIRQKDGYMRYLTAAGEPRIMGFRTDPSTGWVTMAAMDESELTDAISYTRNIGIGALCIGVILIAIVIFLIVRPIIRDLLQGVGFARSVSEGDLDRPLNVYRGDELGTLADALRTMVTSLKNNILAVKEESERARQQSERAQEAMKQAEAASEDAKKKADSIMRAALELEKVASVVSSASNELAAQIAQSERGASDQAARVTETATAMEEMNSTVLEVARNAGLASEVSASTRQRAEAGSTVVTRAVDSIRQVQAQSLRLKDDMTTLDDNAKAINQIMGVISDIADQTNLLALNAAIEAARAGEAGRGFAVVADEVRKLAEKTMASTTDVGNAIRAIQSSATQSMAQVDDAVKTIEEATDFANQSGMALNEIVNMVDNTADQVRAIATASEQQSATSDEINRSIGHVNSIAGETARAMAEAAHAVTSLAEQARVLTRLIDDMKRV